MRVFSVSRLRRVILVRTGGVVCLCAALGCAHVEPTPAGATAPAPSPALAQAAAPTPLPAVERARLEYALTVLDKISLHWPWLGTAQTCVALISADTQWVVDCDKPLAVFAQLNQQFRGRPVFARRGGKLQLPGDREVNTSDFLRATPAAVKFDAPFSGAAGPGTPWIVASSLDALTQFNPQAFGPDTHTEEWLGVFIHEFIHTRQLSEAHFQHAYAEMFSGKLDREKLSALYTGDASYRASVQAEHALLASEAGNPTLDAARTRRVLQQWVRRYAQRRAFLGKQPDGVSMQRADIVFSYVEGIARYVESQFLVDAGDHGGTGPDGDPRFAHFAQWEGQGYRGMLRGVGARYYYAIGMHLGLLLDRVEPTWKQRVHAHPDFVIGLVHDLLAVALQVERSE